MMDTKEAIKELEDLTVDYGDRNEEQIARLDEAIDMAMDALRNLPNRLRQAMDTISREEVIDTVHKIIYGFFSEKDGVMTDTEKTLLSVSKAVCNGVRELPSAQPEKRTEKRTETHGVCLDAIDRQAAIDAIVAQTIGYTVDEIKAECEENIFNENGYLGGLKDAIEAIEDISSAQPERCEDCENFSKTRLLIPQPERKKGKWIPVTRIEKWHKEDGLVGFPPEVKEFPQCTIEWVDATEPDEVDGLRCSECGTVYDFTEARNWCSECGADMRTPVETARDIVHEAIDNSVWSDTVDTAKMHKVVDDKYAEMEGD